MSQIDLMKALSALAEQVSDDEYNENVIEQQSKAARDALSCALDTFSKSHRFTPGELVTWKTGMKNRSVPPYQHAAVVVEVLDAPIYDQQHGSGSPYYREPIDLVLGVFDDDGDFMVFHYDARRFEPYR